MNTTMKLGGGAAAACAACCAASTVPALFASGGLGALTLAANQWGAHVAAGSLAAAGVVLLAIRASRSRASREPSASEPCECLPSPQREAVIACTLNAEDFRERTLRLRDLAKRSLRHATRGRLAMTLFYRAEAKAEIEPLIAMERECCPFLTFSVWDYGENIVVSIIAPAAAADAAGMLFDHFAPELAAGGTKEIG